MLHNLGALEAFQRRTTYGHNLSERVWSIAKQFERHIELSLSIGISEGRSAADISRDVRVYLNEPDKLFDVSEMRSAILPCRKWRRLITLGKAFTGHLIRMLCVWLAPK